MITGYIYKITCKVNNKVYIGQTIQKLQDRLYHHFKDAINNGYKHALANAIRKYGKDNFYIEEIERHSCKTKRDLKKVLNEAEKKYIEIYDSYLNGYNSTLGGDGTLGYNLSDEHRRKISNKLKGHKHTTETKKKISQKHKGKKLKLETINKLKKARANQVFTEEYYKNLRESMKKFRKKVAQYTLSGDFVNVYDSLTEASLKTGISDSTIGMVCTNKRQSGGGYYWVYVKDDNVPQKIDIEINIKTINESKPKPVIQFDKDGNLINEYQSIREASRQTNIVLSSIVENCKGKRKSAGGYMWEYKTNNEV